MTGPISTATAPGRPVPLYRRIRPWHIVAAVGLVAAPILLGWLLQEPRFIDSLTVENPTPYDVRVDVSDDDRSGWMTIGTARRAGATTFEEIIDHGAVWILRFHAQGRSGGELRVERAQLEADEWTVEIPESVGDELRRQGAPLPP